MSSISTWSAILTNPLGLAAFVLAVVFGAVAVKARATPSMRWAALGLAGVAVVGGLFVSSDRHSTQSIAAAAAAASAALPAASISQSSSGNNSPNVAYTGGNVTVSSPTNAASK